MTILTIASSDRHLDEITALQKRYLARTALRFGTRRARRKSDMDMKPVNSSAIEAVGYDPSTRRMRIRFAGGNEYDFCGVPRSVYEALMSASSKGIFYNDHIRDRYQC